MAQYPGTTTLSFAQLEQLWTDQGGDPNYAATMANIALSESSGEYGSNIPAGDNGTSYGLWQIHDTPDAWQNVFGDQTIQASATNPELNAAMAVYIAKTQGIQAWTDAWQSQHHVSGTVAPVSNQYNTTLANAEFSDNASPASSLFGTGNASSLDPGGSLAGATAAGTGVQNAVQQAVTNPIAAEIQSLQQQFSAWWGTHPVGLLIAGILLFVLAVAFIASDKGVEQTAANVAKVGATAA